MEELFRSQPEEQERIGRNVGNYSVALFGVNDSPDFTRVRLVGSGTLVSLNGAHYILTAAHVWQELKKFQSTGLTLREGVDHCFPILNAAIECLEMPETKFDEWGPDIALLRLPETQVGTVEAYRVFYNMDREPQRFEKDHLGVRILVGTPGVLARGEGNVQVVEMQGMYVTVDAKFYDHEKVDLVDIEMDTTLPQVINDFRGVSGGGLWSVQIFPTREGNRFDSTETLVGVAFYQLGLKGNIQTVRCHGPKTIRALIGSITA